ncbi:MAG: iron-containing alcohol dehydrogenase [Pseudomonadota bacterium]|nr:MAG: iron-containing alcohol dehydrogenase [Pseudomonadota bacterium]
MQLNPPQIDGLGGAFNVAALPRIVFGPGRIAELPDLLRPFGKRVLIVTGARSFRTTSRWTALGAALESGFTRQEITVDDEPSPALVDAAVHRFGGQDIEVVVGIGGGSVLDAAKAIAGLLPFGNSVLDHLEGVGRGIAYTGPALPFIAVPTTAGTGSEATKNAVLSVRGEGGYKKSFRHDTLVPRIALVDPDLLASCPAAQVAANGMDAFTQLLESWVSLKASPFTDALAWSGMQQVARGFIDAWRGGDSHAARAGRAAMAYASLLSGITLAQAGLGSVHGLASPLGAFFPIPHGVACGTMLADATRINIAALKARAPESPALPKYAAAGRLLANRPDLDDEPARESLVAQLSEWTELMGMPRLSHYGVVDSDTDRIVADSRGSSMKTNPVVLADEEIAALIRARL